MKIKFTCTGKKHCSDTDCPFKNQTEWGTICNVSDYVRWSKDGNKRLSTTFNIEVINGKNK